jgi:hypothetical protein
MREVAAMAERQMKVTVSAATGLPMQWRVGRATATVAPRKKPKGAGWYWRPEAFGQDGRGLSMRVKQSDRTRHTYEAARKLARAWAKSIDAVLRAPNKSAIIGERHLEILERT